MRADLRRCLLGVALAVAIAAPVCSGEEPVRIGIVTECIGPLSFFNDGMLAAMELPFLERGARLAGRGPGAGIEGADAGGRDVELVRGCTEVGQYAHVIAEVRRLIEERHVDIVLGPLGDPEGVVVRRLAERHRDVTFVPGWGVAQETTLHDPQPNVFRFVADGAQTVAGLGSYAYNELGWRRAAVVSDDLPSGWNSAAGFVTEFCALGGRVVRRAWSDFFTGRFPAAAPLARRADGVALLMTALDPAPFLKDYARHAGPLAQRLVVGGPIWSMIPGALAPKAADLEGVIVGNDVPIAGAGEGWDAHVAAMRRHFPAVPADIVTALHATGAEAVAQALDRVEGDLGPGQAGLRRALAGAVVQSASGPVRLDEHRQLIARVHLQRVGGDGRARPFRVLDGVEQTFGGAFTTTTPGPSKHSPRCRRKPAPPWAG